jgi:hypothetical protein
MDAVAIQYFQLELAILGMAAVRTAREGGPLERLFQATCLSEVVARWFWASPSRQSTQGLRYWLASRCWRQATVYSGERLTLRPPLFQWLNPAGFSVRFFLGRHRERHFGLLRVAVYSETVSFPGSGGTLRPLLFQWLNPAVLGSVFSAANTGTALLACFVLGQRRFHFRRATGTFTVTFSIAE